MFFKTRKRFEELENRITILEVKQNQLISKVSSKESSTVIGVHKH